MHWSFAAQLYSVYAREREIFSRVQKSRQANTNVVAMATNNALNLELSALSQYRPVYLQWKTDNPMHGTYSKGKGSVTTSSMQHWCSGVSREDAKGPKPFGPGDDTDSNPKIEPVFPRTVSLCASVRITGAPHALLFSLSPTAVYLSLEDEYWSLS